MDEEDPSKIEKLLLGAVNYFIDKFNQICIGFLLITDFYLLIDITQLHIIT